MRTWVNKSPSIFDQRSNPIKVGGRLCPLYSFVSIMIFDTPVALLSLPSLPCWLGNNGCQPAHHSLLGCFNGLAVMHIGLSVGKLFKKLKSLNILLIGFENKTSKVTVVVIGFTQVFHPTKTTSITLKQCDKLHLQEIYFIN